MASAVARARAGWPLAAICLYAALIPLQPVMNLPDGSRLRFSTADLAAPLVLLAAIVRPRRRIPFGPGAFAILIPILALFSTLWAAEERPLSMYAVGKTAGLAYLVLLTLATVRATGGDAPGAIMRALATGAFWSAVVGLVAYGAYLNGYPTSLMEGDRLCSTMVEDANIYGSLLAVALVVTATERSWSPATRAVRCAVLAAALLAAGSRSAMLGTLAAFTVVGLVRSRDPFALAVAVAAALSTAAGSAAAAGLWAHHWREFTIESRLDLYARAFQQFADHPVVGLGIGGFHDLNQFEIGTVVEHFVVHNTYLWAFVDLGVAGGVLVVGLLAAALARCVRAARGRPPVDEAAAVAAGLAAMAVFNLFIDGFYQRHFWVLVACAIGMPVYRAVRRPTWAVAPAAAEGAVS
jgi:O-antigen ligase